MSYAESRRVYSFRKRTVLGLLAPTEQILIVRVRDATIVSMLEMGLWVGLTETFW